MNTLRRKRLRPSPIDTSPRSSPDVWALLCPGRSLSTTTRTACAFWPRSPGAIHGVDWMEQRIEQCFDESKIQPNRAKPTRWIIERGENRLNIALMAVALLPPPASPPILHAWSSRALAPEIERMWKRVSVTWKSSRGLSWTSASLETRLTYELYFRIISKAQRQPKAFAIASGVTWPRSDMKRTRGAAIRSMARRWPTVSRNVVADQQHQRPARRH